MTPRQAVDAGDAVAHLQHAAHLVDLKLLREPSISRLND